MSDAAITAPPMSEAVQKIMPVIETLTPPERAFIREYLDALLENPGLSQDDWEAAWDEEVGRRLAAAKQDGDDLMPAEEFFRQLRERRK